MSNEHFAMEIKLCLAAVLGTLTALWGWFGWLVLVWAALMLADWLIGSAVAAKDGKWSSGKMRAGAWHKGGMIVIVCVALTADWLIGTLLHNLPVVELPFTYGVLLGPLVIVWYVVGELGSLAEHAIAMGAPYPAWLPKILEAGKNAVDKVGEELTGPPTEPSEAGPVGRGGARERTEPSRTVGAKLSGLCDDEADGRDGGGHE